MPQPRPPRVAQSCLPLFCCSIKTYFLKNIADDVPHQAAMMMSSEGIAKLVIATAAFKIMYQLFANQARSQTTGHAHTDLSGIATHQILEEPTRLPLYACRSRHTSKRGATLRAVRRPCRNRAH